MAEFPALPIWTDALIADTTHLTPAEFGAYMRLLVAAWRRRDCALPNDDVFLSRIVGERKNWSRLKPVVMAFFDLDEDGFYRQKRLLRERESVSAKVEQRRSAGRSSALKRKEGRSTTVATEGATKRQLSKPISKSISPPNPPTGGAAAPSLFVELGDRLCEIAGMRSFHGNYSIVQVWLDRGYPPHLIESAVRTVAERDGYEPPGSLRYFDKMVAQHVEGVLSRPETATEEDDSWRQGTPEEIRWRACVEVWKNGTNNGKHKPGTWFAELNGPPPDDPGCLCPPEILAEFGINYATGEAS